MTELKAVFLCVAGALVCAVLRPQKPELRLAAAVAAGLVAASFSLDGLRTGMEGLKAISGQAGMEESSVLLLIRATGIAMIADFGAQLCRDADESALAGRVELAGRVALMGMTLPLLSGFAVRLTDLLP